MIKRLPYYLLLLVALCFFVQGNASARDNMTAMPHQQEMQGIHAIHGDAMQSAYWHGKQGLCNLHSVRKYQIFNDRQANIGYIWLGIPLQATALRQPIIHKPAGSAHLTELLKSLLYPKHSFW